MQMLSLTIVFPHPPNKYTIYADLTSSRQFWPPPPTVSVCLGGRGVGVVTTTPLCNSSSAVIPVLSYPLNVATSTNTTSCVFPVSLYVWVLNVSIPFVPVTVSSIRSPISASVKLTFTWRFKGDPENPDVLDHVSRMCPYKGACERVYDLKHSPLDW